jgi:hypothetical protein
MGFARGDRWGVSPHAFARAGSRMKTPPALPRHQLGIAGVLSDDLSSGFSYLAPSVRADAVAPMENCCTYSMSDLIWSIESDARNEGMAPLPSVTAVRSSSTENCSLNSCDVKSRGFGFSLAFHPVTRCTQGLVERLHLIRLGRGDVGQG